jgi:hypothetical protein
VQRHLAGLDLGQVEDVVDQLEQVLAGAVRLRERLVLLRRERAVDALAHERRVAEDHVDRRAQLVAHVGEELALEPRRLLQLEALPLQLAVALLELERRAADAVLELVVELLQLAREPLVLLRLRQVVDHADDRDGLAARRSGSCCWPLRPGTRGRLRIDDRDALDLPPLGAQQEVADQRGEARVVRLDLLARAAVARSIVDHEQPVRLRIHQHDVGAARP